MLFLKECSIIIDVVVCLFVCLLACLSNAVGNHPFAWRPERGRTEESKAEENN